MTVEEILIKLGVDASTVASGLRSAQGMFADAGAKIRAGLNSAFNSLAAPFTLAGIGVQLGKTLSLVENIKAAADAKGVSTNFIQDINNLGKASGLNEKAIDGMLNKFMRMLPVGSDVEAAFMGMADKIAGITDPAERARVAVDAFGKSGMDMLRILSGGSDGIREAAKAFDKFSESEMKAIEEADAQLDKLGNRITIWTGKAVSGISSVFARMGELSVGGNKAGGEEIVSLAKMRREEAAKLAKQEAKAQDDTSKKREEFSKANADALYNELSLTEKVHWHTVAIAQAKEDMSKLDKESVGYWDKRLEIAKEEKQLAEVNKKISDEEAKNIERKLKAEAERKKLLDQIAALQSQRENAINAYKPSVSELAGMTGSKAQTAQRIQFLEGEIKKAFASGDTGAAQRMIDEIEGTGKTADPRALGRGALGGGTIGRGTLGGLRPDTRGLRARIEDVVNDPTQQKLGEMNDKLKELNEKLTDGIPVYGKED